MSSDEEFYQDEEENVTNELDYDIPEPDYTIYNPEDDEQVVTDKDKPLDVPIHLIRLGQRIKHNAPHKRRQKKSTRARS